MKYFKISSINKLLTIFFIVVSIIFIVDYSTYILHLPLLEFQSFRQTQTALSVLTMLHADGFSLVLPVAGRVNLPLEFPLFQYIVYLAVKIMQFFNIEPSLGVLTITGRLIANFFLLLTSVVLFLNLKSHHLDCKIIIVTIISLLSSPYFLPLDFVFLIDSFALFLATTSVILYLNFYNKNYAVDYIYYIFIIFLTIALMQKVTTVFCLYIFFGIHILLSKSGLGPKKPANAMYLA